MERIVLPGGEGFCNAVRRTLISDTHSWAPSHITMRRNTSCQTDEFLAHRIGLIPFAGTGNNPNVNLCKSGPCRVTAGDFSGLGFEAVHPEIEVMVLGEHQELDLSVHFDRKTGKDHARYAMCAGVGMKKLDADRCEVTFTCNDKRRGKDVLSEALTCLQERVDKALLSLAHPVTPHDFS